MNHPRIATDLALLFAYGGVVHYRAGEQLPLRRLPDYELVLIIEGQVIYESNGRSYEAVPGSIILAQPGVRESYRWDPRSLTRHAYVHFDIAALPRDLPPTASWPVLFREPDPVALPLFRHLTERLASQQASAATAPGPDVTCLLEALVRVLLRPLGDCSLATGKLPEAVMHALNTMRLTLDMDPHQALRLRDIARHAGVSEKHLCRLFSEALGYSPMQTLRLLRLQLGLALLGQSNLSIQEVADRCGFANPLYFSRCFTQTYGRSPSAIRKAMRGGQPPPANPLPSDITPRIFW